jgi:hypothetical protein
MKKSFLILLFFIAVKLILQYYAINPVYELHRDEFLHLDLGKHLAWIILHLGGSVFWVKFFPVVFGVLLIVVVRETVRALKGGIYAQILAASGVIFTVLVRINILYQPNSADYLLWTLLFYFLIRYFGEQQPKWLYFLALTFAVAFLNKYNICFLIAGFVPAFLITRDRIIFTRKHFWLAAAMALVLILPNLIWQFENGFPVWHHFKELAGTQLVHVDRFNFLKDQLYFFFGSIPVILLGLVAFYTYPPFRKFRVVFWVFFFTLAVFVIMRAKNYYAIGLYPVYIALGAVYLESLVSDGRLRWILIPAVLLPVLFFIPLYPYALPVKSPETIMRQKKVFDTLRLTYWEDGKMHNLPQDFADMLGWKEMAHLVDSAFQMVDEKDRTIVHCDNYGQAGAVNYYTGITGMEAYSESADYINWYPLDKFEIVNVILVKQVNDKDPGRDREKAFFEEVRLIGQISNPYAREKGTKVYLLRKARISVNEVLRKEISERKQEMRIN